MKYLPNFLTKHHKRNMLKLFKIAKLEINILFYSPVAWLVLAIFTVQNGMGFFGMFQGMQEAISMGSRIDNLTFAIFPGLGGLFDKVTETLYLYIPLLSMGLMSRETSSGSIKLLLSSPVRIREIILGKYLAIATYCFILILILAAYSVTGIAIIKNADITLVLSGLFGILLLSLTYAAIGLFMSSLTSYQVVAAISTLAVLAALRFVGNLGQDINFVRDLTYFLSISGRADDMLKGLITTKDVFYFLLIISLFLWLCILRLQAGRESQPWTYHAGKYSILICAILFLGYISSRPSMTGYLDMTATKNRTLTVNSQKVARMIEGPLTITTYVNLLDANVYSGLPAARNGDLARFEQYRRFIPGLRLKYVYYYDATDLKNNSNMVYQGDIRGLSIKQIAERVADNMGIELTDFLTPEQIRKKIDLSPEDNNFVRVLEYKGRTSYLRLYNEMNRFPEEAEITAAIKKLVTPLNKVGFATGNNERSIEKTGDRNYQLLSSMKKRRNALVNQGFDVVDVDLNKENIPDDVSLFVLGDPTRPLSDTARQKVSGYLEKGKDMLIAGEPGRQDILNPVLKPLGVELMAGMLINPSRNEAPDRVYGSFPADTVLADQAFHGLQKYGAYIATPGAAAIKLPAAGAFVADTLLKSAPTGWNGTRPVDLTVTEVHFDPLVGDKRGVFPIVVTMTRKLAGHTQKILVSGDADFLSNSVLAQTNAYNLRFSADLFKWFSGEAFPVNVDRPIPTDDVLLVKRKQLSGIKLGFLGVIPALIVALGAFKLISRKRK
jgi:ABC-2 type transport system permease protein